MDSYPLTLSDFMDGKATIEQLEDSVAGRLTQLRATPEVIPEQAALSRVELMIEEVKEELRDILDLYIAVLMALEERGIRKSELSRTEVTRRSWVDNSPRLEAESHSQRT